jgi:hypothetical protein
MSKCNDCNALDKAKSIIEPHGNLNFLRSVTYKSDGMRNAHRLLYRCKDCATPWSRDMDSRDAGAIWEIDTSIE